MIQYDTFSEGLRPQPLGQRTCTGEDADAQWGIGDALAIRPEEAEDCTHLT